MRMRARAHVARFNCSMLESEKEWCTRMNCGQCGSRILPQEESYRDMDGCEYHKTCDKAWNAIARNKRGHRERNGMARYYMVPLKHTRYVLDRHGRLVLGAREANFVLKGHKKPREGACVYADIVGGGKAIVGVLTRDRYGRWEVSKSRTSNAEARPPESEE